jgi:hypothetical protein
MSKANKRKSEFLGMSFGTACHRLRKEILFWLVKETGRDRCYRCGKEIESVAELSIEHKESWLGVDKSLFWDLNNISFSHLNCNIRSSRIGVAPSNKIQAPEGTSWCPGCKEFLPLHKFSKKMWKDSTKTVRVCCKLCRQKGGARDWRARKTEKENSRE